MTTLHISLLIATMAFASVDVEACNRPKPPTPMKDCPEWCSSLANCTSGFGKKPSEQNCWFDKTSSDPTADLLNGIVENNVYTNTKIVSQFDLLGRPTMQHSMGRAVDGTYGSGRCTPILLRRDGYWGVNLGGRYKITKVEIPGLQKNPITWFRRGLATYRVFVSDVELNPNTANDFSSSVFKLCKSYSLAGSTLTARCDSHEGSFVYIHTLTTPLNARLCRARVFVSGSCCEHQVPETDECPTKVNNC